jgi:hypothetical protein
MQENRRRRLLPPSGVAPLGAGFGLLARGCDRLGRCELGSVSQHRVHDDPKAASRSDSRFAHC